MSCYGLWLWLFLIKCSLWVLFLSDFKIFITFRASLNGPGISLCKPFTRIDWHKVKSRYPVRYGASIWVFAVWSDYVQFKRLNVGDQSPYMIRDTKLWFVLQRRPVKAQTSLCIRTGLSELSHIVYIWSGCKKKPLRRCYAYNPTR